MGAGAGFAQVGQNGAGNRLAVRSRARQHIRRATRMLKADASASIVAAGSRLDRAGMDEIVMP